MSTVQAFEKLGTRLLHPPEELAERVKRVKAIVFDWDGVFNDGWKDREGGSPFSEVDSMGVNLLRFALWQQHRKMLPCAIITGQHNPYAERFAEREHLDAVFMGFSHKPEAFDSFLETHELEADEVAFLFDDVLDLPVARRCGIRILMKRESSPLMEAHVIAQGDADVITALSGGQHGIREACELLMTLNGNGAATIEHRVGFTAEYQAYLSMRGEISAKKVSKSRP